MKRIFTLALAAIMVMSIASCSDSDSKDSDNKKAKKSSSEATVTTEESSVEESSDTAEISSEEESTASADLDVSSLNWVKGELDCYGYDDCYMSFKYPDNFKTGTEDSSGMQYRGYNFNPENPESAPNDSPYGIYIYFNQGAFGAKRETLEADIEGGFKEIELGGRKVLFGSPANDPNTGSYAFSYYVQYDEDEYSRIWFIVTDPEQDGEFRKTFEESISFTK